MRVPKYRVRKDRDSAYVEMDGQRIPLPGRANSPESRDEYRRLLNDYLLRHGSSDDKDRVKPSWTISVGSLVALWLKERKLFYSTSHTRSNDYSNCRYAVRPLVALFEGLAVVDFRADELKEVRSAMITGRWKPSPNPDGTDRKPPAPWSRNHTNAAIGRIKRMFRWGLEHGMVPAENAAIIAAVPPLEKGRTFARETAPVQPVSDEVVDNTLPHLPAVVRAMVTIHRLTGMRSDNLCAMRPADIDRTAGVWIYRPAVHKGSHLERDLAVPLGPKCQAALLPYLERRPDLPCFSPQESTRRPAGSGKRRPGKRYTTGTYRNAIRRACLKHGIPVWHPHQLRHSAANAAKRARGLDGARAYLGHSLVSTTEIYEERDLALAVEIAREIG